MSVSWIGIGVWLATASAAPWDPASSISWRAPEGCPDEDAVRGELRALLVRAPEDLDRPEIHVDATAARDIAEGWRLQLEIRTTNGIERRELAAARCETLGGTTALLVAMMLDPVATREGLTETLVFITAPARSARAHPPREAAETRVRPPAPEPTIPKAATHESGAAPPMRRARRNLRGALRLAGAGGLGGLPRLAGGLQVAVALLWPHARAEIEAHYWFGIEKSYAPPFNHVGGQFMHWAIGPRGCGVPTVRRLEFPLCAGVELGAIGSVGLGVTDPARDRSLWAAANLGPAIAWTPVPAIAIRAGVDLLVPFAHPSYSVGTLGRLWRVPPAGVRFALGVEVRLP